MANRPDILDSSEDPKLPDFEGDADAESADPKEGIEAGAPEVVDTAIDPRADVASYLEEGKDDPELLGKIGEVSTKVQRILFLIDAAPIHPTRHTPYSVDKLHHPNDAFDMREYLRLRNRYLLRAIDALVITLKDLLNKDYSSAGRAYLEMHGGIQSPPMSQKDVELILKHNPIFVVRRKSDGGRPTMVGAYTTNDLLNANGGGALYPVETVTLGKSCYDLLEGLQHYESGEDDQEDACTDALCALDRGELVHGAYITVDEDYRRKGIGTVLKAAVYKYLIDAGKTHLFLRSFFLQGIYRQRPGEETPVLVHPFNPPVENIPSARLNRSDDLMRLMGYESVFRKLTDMGDPLMEMPDRLQEIRRLLLILINGNAATSVPLESSDSSSLLLGFHNLHWLVKLEKSYEDHLRSLAIKNTLKKRFRVP